MADFQWLLEYLKSENVRLQKIALGFQAGITKHEQVIEKHRKILEGDMFVENKWQHGNGITKAEEAILNLQVMLSQVGKKITKLKEAEVEITKLV